MQRQPVLRLPFAFGLHKNWRTAGVRKASTAAAAKKQGQADHQIGAKRTVIAALHSPGKAR